MDLELQLRAAEARRADLERQYSDALMALRGGACANPDVLDARQSRARELEKKVALETVRCEELQLELAAANASSQRLLQTTTAGGRYGAMNDSSTEIDRIMAKIEQDNRILAELDHSRSTTTAAHLGTSPPTLSPPIYSSLYTPTAHHQHHHHHSSKLLSMTTPATSFLGHHSVLPPLMGGTSGATVTFSNPLTSQFNSLSLGAGATSSSSTALSNKLSKLYMDDSGNLGSSTAAWNMPSSLLGGGGGCGGGTSSGAVTPSAARSALAVDTSSMLDNVGLADWTNTGTDRSTYLNGHHTTGGTMSSTAAVSTEGQVDMLDIPGKGRCSIYIARFSYDPDPDAEEELGIQAGDYLLVWGDPVNPGGFLDAELLDGRRGLVPSHFVQRLIGDDLLEFHQAVLSTLRDDEINQESFAADVQKLNEIVEMSDVPEDDGPEVPAPRQLTLERQLNKSVLISWTQPEAHCPGAPIDSYHVYVDGNLKATLKASERTRALVEGVENHRPHRISVRSVTTTRRTSRDAACTMIIGRDTHLLGPSCVRASNITSTSACISWLPANSNHQHVVCVNSVEVRTVRPGVYKHTITGLTANTQYRVTVRAKHQQRGGVPPTDASTTSISAVAITSHSSGNDCLLLAQMPAQAHTDFRTLPKGVPDPPAAVLVEPGPQDGTLLVTWQPILTQPYHTATVTGYAVFADGKKVSDVDSPTGDHALIDISKLLGMNPKQVTVRTKCRDNLSADSPPTPIPLAVLTRSGNTSTWPPQHGGGQRQQQLPQQPHSTLMRRQQPGTQQQQQMYIEPDENLSDKEIFPNMVMGTTSNVQNANSVMGNVQNRQQPTTSALGKLFT